MRTATFTVRVGKPMTDPVISVPISKLPQFVRETSEDFESRGITACHLGQVLIPQIERRT